MDYQDTQKKHDHDIENVNRFFDHFPQRVFSFCPKPTNPFAHVESTGAAIATSVWYYFINSLTE